jgi:hypothetical protein
MHNDFIIWMYDNHLDSCVYYQGDDPAFSTFVRKKFEDYFEVELTDFSSYVIDDGDFVIDVESIDDFEDIEAATDWTTEEYDSVEVVFNKVHDAFLASPTNIQVALDSLASGIEDIDDEDFSDEDEILESLGLWGYSLQVSSYIGEEEGASTVGFWRCLLFAAWADIYAYQYFDNEYGGQLPEHIHLGAMAQVSLEAGIMCLKMF